MQMPAPADSPGVLTPTPAAAPSANLGAQAAAMQKIKALVQELQTLLPNIPLDSPLHKEVMKFVSGAAKNIPATGGQDQGLNASMLRDMALRQQQQSPLLAAMQKAGGAGGAPGAPQGASAPAPQGE